MDGQPGTATWGGPPKKADALRRNRAHCRERLKAWREAHPEKVEGQRERSEATRAQRYQAWPEYYLWRTAKARAKQTGHEFSIAPEDVVIPQACPITGDAISILSAAHRNGASLDRVDNSRGYVPGNVRVISRRANRIKGDADIPTLERVIAYMKGEV